MIIRNKTLSINSDGDSPTFHNITKDVKDFVRQSEINDGLCVVYSHHTTCSVIIEEPSHDITSDGIEYLQQDLCNIMERIIPSCHSENNQYLHPGPEHLSFAMELGYEPGEWVCYNTDAHLRSSVFGRSETMVIKDRQLDLGNFGAVYFVDWDQVRKRKRLVQIQIIGE